MNSDNTYDSINEVLNQIQGNYKIMEETIDLETQKDYYELIKSIDDTPSIDDMESLIETLNNEEASEDDLRNALVRLAMLDSVEAFRALEKYSNTDNPNIKDWAILALQQSRMVIQSSLLEEQQVYISTGLGGKGNKLRYYLIFPYNFNNISDTQKNALTSEIEFYLKQHDGDVEEFEYQSEYACAMVLLPLTANIPDLVKSIINECNQLGNFLSPDVLITNMKRFQHDEVLEIIDKYDKSE